MARKSPHLKNKQKKGQAIVEYVILMMVFAMLLTVVSKAVLDGFGTAFNKFGAAFAKTINY